MLAAACGPKSIPSLISPADVELIGAYVFPGIHLTGRSGDEIGGLSGVWFDEALGHALMVTDDAMRPRIVPMEVRLLPQVEVIVLMPRPLMPAAPGRSFDLEALAPSPEGHLFVTSEGETIDPEDQLPGIFEFARDGRLLRQLPLPAAYAGLDQDRGLEGVSLSPDKRYLFAATENGLRQDGPGPDLSRGALSRILVVDLHGHPTREYAYSLDPIPPLPGVSNATGTNGVSEVLSLGSGRLLVLERAFTEEESGPRSANSIRIYQITLEPDAEITGRWSLRDEPPTAPLRKTLVFDLGTVAAHLPARLRTLENFEAMTWGPTLPDGRRSLLLVSDDNFSESQVTALVALAVEIRQP